MRRAILIVLFAGLVGGWCFEPLSARQPYFDEFKGKYGGDPDYDKVIMDTKCFICHVGKTKKNRNDYGKALSKVIGKMEKDKEKIRAALGKVEDEKSSDGKTFGELIKEHKLPGGPPQKE